MSERQTVEHLVGTVLESTADELLVRVGTAARPARRAVTCLSAPKPGDTVALVGVGERSFVTAVLESDGEHVLQPDGDLRVALDRGRFVVAAQHGVDVLSGADVQVLGASFDVQAVEGKAAFERTTLVATEGRVEAEQIEAVATSFDAVIERAARRIKRLFRKVDESDQLRAGRIDITAKQEASLHAENALVTAEELVKIDGEQVQVG